MLGNIERNASHANAVVDLTANDFSRNGKAHVTRRPLRKAQEFDPSIAQTARMTCGFAD